MKILISLSVFSIASMLSTTFNSNENQEKADADIPAYRLTNFNDINDPDDDQHVYFNNLNCANSFQTLHPEYVRNGKVTVPEQWVFICFNQ